VSARQIALALQLDYGFVKRIVRGLVAWRILSATPEGLSFQAEAPRWAAPAAPAAGRQRESPTHLFPAACRVPKLAKALNVVQRRKMLSEPQRSMTSQS